MGGYCIGIAVEFVRQLPITTSRTIPYFTRIKEMDWVEFEPRPQLALRQITT
jgi:hypothetical protein